jgi:hypothetical protein
MIDSGLLSRAAESAEEVLACGAAPEANLRHYFSMDGINVQVAEVLKPQARSGPGEVEQPLALGTNDVDEHRIEDLGEPSTSSLIDTIIDSSTEKLDDASTSLVNTTDDLITNSLDNSGKKQRFDRRTLDNYHTMRVARGNDDSKAFCSPCGQSFSCKTANGHDGFYEHIKTNHREPYLEAGGFAVCCQSSAVLKGDEVVYEGQCQAVITGANYQDHYRMHAIKSVFCKICGECVTRRDNFKTRHAKEATCLRCSCGKSCNVAKEFLDHKREGCVTLGPPTKKIVGNRVVGTSVTVRLVCELPKGTQIEGTLLLPIGPWLDILKKTHRSVMYGARMNVDTYLHATQSSFLRNFLTPTFRWCAEC